MREIRFRGKRIDNGEWVYGNYLLDEQHDKPRHCIWYRENVGDFIANGIVGVDPKTVGQFTGLKDKNGKEIYEGDILDVDGTPWLVEPIGTEERDGGKFGLCASPYGSGEAYFIDKSILDGKVIGNIYENPELLKGEETA